MKEPFKIAGFLLLGFVVGIIWSWLHRAEPAGTSGAAAPVEVRAGHRYPTFLPAEAAATLEAIERRGPFAYERDGGVFGNREHRLPERPDGYYREYTVATPGSPDRGARRIVTGGDPPEVYYYTDDHYRSFRQFEVGE
jgi:guanyl-specific ribonuclease Sa